MTPVNLNPIISAIAGLGNSVVKKKLERDELVIKLLKQFNLDPDHPPADFSGVYQYALVEYGLGKPKPILELFRQKDIQQAFRQALDQNDPSIILQETEDFLDWNTLGDEIRELGINPCQELYEFTAVFIQIVKLTRTPAQVLEFQQIESLHQKIEKIQEQLKRLPTAEGMRTLIAELIIEQRDPALLPAEASTKKKPRALLKTVDNPSPFIVGPPITHPRNFFGREREIKRLFNLLKHHPLQNAAIIGKRRSGKTSLLKYLENITTTSSEQLRLGQKSDWLPNPENYCWIFIDFQDSRMASRERLLAYILECLRIPVPAACDLDCFMDLVSDNLNRPTVILMDEIGVGLQRCPELDDEFWESLRSLATNYTEGNLGFVLATPESPIELAHHTGHSSPFFNIFGYTTTLGPLKEPEARELIASSPISFPVEDREWILNQSGRWPLLLQILCRERLFTIEDNETDDQWREEGLKQIKPFRYLL